MDILFIVPYTPTVIRPRPLSLLHGLRRRGHTVTLATVWERDRDRQQLEHLAQQGIRILSARLSQVAVTRNVLAALASGKPMQALYAWEPHLAALLSQELARQQFDVVHVEHLRGAEYGRLARAQLLRSAQRTPVVWDSVDCITQLFQQAARHSRSLTSRLLTRIELPRTRRYEAQSLTQFDGVLVTAPADRAALEALAPSHAVNDGAAASRSAPRPYVLPNGVDTDFFCPSADVVANGHIIFTGKMSYHANVTAVLHLVSDIMPHVWRRLPHTRVVIAGQSPPPAIRALAQQDPSRITVTGFVSDLRPFLRAASVAVAPIAYGAGIQNKVLEAMACGIPVIASPQATAALQARSEHELLVAETPESFASAIVRVLENEGLRTQVGAAGRRYVECHHQWDAITAQLETIYHDCRERQASGELMIGGDKQ